MIIDLNEENFLFYAIKAYNKTNCIASEFEDDLRRIKYIKRLLRRYKLCGKMKERLILNHIVILSNVFGVEAAVRMLFFRLDREYYEVLKTFLLFLNYMPKTIQGINGKNINSADISIDVGVARKLREI